MAVITNFGVPTPGASNGTTLMPKLQYRFRVTFTRLGTESRHDVVTQNVISVSRPSLTHEEVVVDSYNSKMYLAGKHTWETLTLTLRDDMTSEVIKQLGSQLNMQVDHADQSSAVAGASYKFEMKIETLDGGNGDTPAQPFDVWELKGCYLQGVAYGDLNYATSDMVQVTATIRYDHALHTVNGQDVLSAGSSGGFGDGATTG